MMASDSTDIGCFRDWLKGDVVRAESPWLILGKGPSFARLSSLQESGAMEGMLRIGLNHVVRETRLDVFHCIDIEVVEQCGQAILDNAGIAVLPWIPHVRRQLMPFSTYWEFLPSRLNLAEYVDRIPVLSTLKKHRRLYWYNLRTAPRRKRRPEAPITPVRGFSASAVIHLLGEAGIKRIHTLGIDGGTTYAGGFADLDSTTRLAAEQASFDSQFASIADAIQRYNLVLTSLDKSRPLRIRIDIAEGNRLSADVLVQALRRYSSVSLHCDIVDNRASGKPSDEEDKPDITIGGHCLSTNDARFLCKAQDLRQHVHCWSAKSPRPWIQATAIDAHLWCEELLAAIAVGAIRREQVADAIAADAARPSLLEQVDRGISDPLLLPGSSRRHDPIVQPASLKQHLQSRLRQLGRVIGWIHIRRTTSILLDKAKKIMRHFSLFPTR